MLVNEVLLTRCADLVSQLSQAEGCSILYH